MTPIEAAKAEVCAELDSLARQLGPAAVPDAVVIRVEFDRQTRMPRSVERHQEHSRRILGSTVPCGGK